MALTPLKLQKSLSPTNNTDPKDVMAAKSALRALGHYQTPSYGMTPYPDDQMFDAIKGFQRQRGLRVDGVMKPGGETEAAMNKSNGKVTSNSVSQCIDDVNDFNTQLEKFTAAYDSYKTALATGDGWEKKHQYGIMEKAHTKMENLAYDIENDCNQPGFTDNVPTLPDEEEVA